MEIRTVLTIETEDEDCDPVEKVEDLLHTIVSNYEFDGECVCDYASIHIRNNENEEWKNILGVIYKMPKCPRCGEEIDYLRNWQSGETEYRLFSNGTYEGEDFVEDNKVNDYECPECSEVLFTDEEKAIAFLKGKEEKNSDKK